MAERPTYRDLQENLAALGEEVALLRARIAAAQDLYERGPHLDCDLAVEMRRALIGGTE